MDSSITLFIQGHGREDINVSFNNDNSVELLSFVGIPGDFGRMKLCPSYKNVPIDILVLNQLHRKYFYNNSSNYIDQQNIFNSMGEELKVIYKNCGINYKDGFSYTWPILEREFVFEPNEHENCRICNDPDPEHVNFLSNKCISGRCLPDRNKKNICCPEYGLTIVTSSFPEDKDFTLAGYGDRTTSNININLMARDYWKNRTPDYKYLVDQIYNEKYIYLTDLYLLFKSMGFNHIFIYDPSCRDCEIDEKKAEEYKNLERIPPSERIFTSQPTNIIFSSDEDPVPKTNYFEDCINGICGYGKKKKDGGKSRRKVYKKGKTRRKVFKKGKTKKIKKIKYLHNKKNKHGFIIRKAID
jgi:hypothetical protein